MEYQERVVVDYSKSVQELLTQGGYVLGDRLKHRIGKLGSNSKGQIERTFRLIPCNEPHTPEETDNDLKKKLWLGADGVEAFTFCLANPHIPHSVSIAIPGSEFECTDGCCRMIPIIYSEHSTVYVGVGQFEYDNEMSGYFEKENIHKLFIVL